VPQHGQRSHAARRPLAGRSSATPQEGVFAVLTSFRRARSRPLAALALVLVVLVGSGGPTTAYQSEFGRVRSIAVAQMGDPWVWGAVGPYRFDCVGLVYYAFRRAGLADRIGGYRGVASYRAWFAARGRVSRRNPRRGDLVIWGNNQHIGIYLGDGRAISTLTSSGVSIRGIHGLNIPFTTFLHVRISR